MSLHGDGVTYLYYAGALGGTPPYLDNIWAYMAGAALIGNVLLTTGASSTSADQARTLRAGNGSPNVAVVRERNTANANNNVTATDVSNAGKTAVAIANWVSYTADWFASTTPAYRRGYANGGIAAAATTTSQTMSAAAHTRFMGEFDNTASSNDQWMAEPSRWNTAGFSEANRIALVSRLTTLVSGEIVDPREVNADAGQPWTGKLIWHITMRDRSVAARTNTIGTEVFSEIGTWADTQIHAHPAVKAYSVAGASKFTGKFGKLLRGKLG